MACIQIIDEELNAVAAHLRGRRDAILDAWRAAADANPQLTTADSIFRVIVPRRYAAQQSK
jgi:hypothetical protein